MIRGNEFLNGAENSNLKEKKYFERWWKFLSKLNGEEIQFSEEKILLKKIRKNN